MNQGRDLPALSDSGVPAPADIGAYARIRRAATQLARQYASDLHHALLDSEAFDKTLNALANDGRIDAAALASIAEAYTGQAGHSSRAESLACHPPRIRRQSARFGPCRAFWIRRPAVRLEPATQLVWVLCASREAISVTLSARGGDKIL